MERSLVVGRRPKTSNPPLVIGVRSSFKSRSHFAGRPAADRRQGAVLANDQRRTADDVYFNVAANCLTVLMNVSVARVRVRSRL